MPRLRPVPRADIHAAALPLFQLLFGDRDPIDDTDTDTPGNWWSVFALVPDIFDHSVAGFGLYRGSSRRLDPQLRELGQIRVGWARASQFVFSQHCKSCRTVGLSEQQIAAIPSWSTAGCFSDAQRAVLAYTDCLVLDGGRVPDPLFEELQSHLGDEEILELTYITSMYDMHAVMAKALRLEFDDVAERIVEVPGSAESVSVEHTRSFWADRSSG